MTYRHTSEMGQISGFGGGYEEACQDMLEAGVCWLAHHPTKDLAVKYYPNAYGLLSAESDSAKELEKVILDANPGCSGAQHQTVMMRLGYIATNGWAAYVTSLINQEEE